MWFTPYILGCGVMPRKTLDEKLDRELRLEIEGSVQGVILVADDLKTLSLKDLDNLKLINQMGRELARYAGRLIKYSETLFGRRLGQE